MVNTWGWHGRLGSGHECIHWLFEYAVRVETSRSVFQAGEKAILVSIRVGLRGIPFFLKKKTDSRHSAHSCANDNEYYWMRSNKTLRSIKCSAGRGGVTPPRCEAELLFNIPITASDSKPIVSKRVCEVLGSQIQNQGEERIRATWCSTEKMNFLLKKKINKMLWLL